MSVVILDSIGDVFELAPTCPDPTALAHFVRAARAFCMQSRWLRRSLDSFQCEANEPFYELTQGTGDPLLEIIGVRVVTAQNVTAPLSAWPVNPMDGVQNNRLLNPGPPQTYQYVPEAAINLFPTPDQAYTILVTAQVQPREDAVEIPDDLWRRWREGLLAGTLSTLLKIKDQPWTDRAEARDQGVKFQAAINNARADEARGYTTGTRMSRIRAIF